MIDGCLKEVSPFNNVNIHLSKQENQIVSFFTSLFDDSSFVFLIGRERKAINLGIPVGLSTLLPSGGAERTVQPIARNNFDNLKKRTKGKINSLPSIPSEKLSNNFFRLFFYIISCTRDKKILRRNKRIFNASSKLLNRLKF